jgi:hypothetical protein
MFYLTRENRSVVALFIILLVVSTIFLIKPFYDNDFFWHLKTGEWIWQHGTLPTVDVFSYTTPSTLTPAITFTLSSYWFSQLILYLAYFVHGMSGIVVVRFLVTGLLFYAMFRRQRGEQRIYMSLMLLFAIMILNMYLIERPQTASFVCFGLLLAILDHIRRNPSFPDTGSMLRNSLMLSAVMLVWANSHGGYLVGQATIILIVCMEGIKFLHVRLKPMPLPCYRQLVLAGSCGVLCSLVNPNTYKALTFTLQTRLDNTSTQILEFSSMPEFYSSLHPPVLIIYFAIMATLIILVPTHLKKADITEVVLLVFLGYFAFIHIRYAAFFAIAVIPVVGELLSENPLITRGARKVLPVIAIVMAMITVQKEFSTNITAAWNGAWINDRLFPEKAADFVRANNLQGNMYNDYDWGGYLIWRLAPERKVFADGRNLNTETLALDYQIKTAYTNSAGDKIWKQLLQRYGVNYVVTESRLASGEVTPFVNALLSDKEWAPVFLHRSSRSIIFVRNTPEHASIIAQSNFGGV